MVEFSDCSQRIFIICICISLISTYFAIITLSYVMAGANDLHLYDGTSLAEIINGDIFFEIVDPAELQYTYRIRPAKNFGAPFNSSFKLQDAKLVPSKPLDACTTLINDEDIEGNVAFIERGECSFLHKAVMAEQAGARAVIITENNDLEPWDTFIEMIDDKSDRDVNIPTAFLIGRSGVMILRSIEKLKRPAIINIPINMTYVPYNKMNQPPWVSW